MRQRTLLLFLFVLVSAPYAHGQSSPLPTSESTNKIVALLLQQMDKVTQLYDKQLSELKSYAVIVPELRKQVVELQTEFSSYKQQAQSDLQDLTTALASSNQDLTAVQSSQRTALDSYNKSEANWEAYSKGIEAELSKLRGEVWLYSTLAGAGGLLVGVIVGHVWH